MFNELDKIVNDWNESVSKISERMKRDYEDYKNRQIENLPKPEDFIIKESKENND